MEKSREIFFFFSVNLKKFPFQGDTVQPWNKNPKLDKPFSKASKNTDLASDDMGLLRDLIDKRRYPSMQGL